MGTILVKLKISKKESDLVRVALMDVMVNSPNFSKFEADVLADVYNRMKRHDKWKARLLKKWH